MAIVQAPMTELEAVNVLLSSIGDAPVNSLTNPGLVTADMARQILHECNRATQSEGWYWNTEDDYTLTPDISGFLNLPTNAVRMIPRRDDDNKHLIVRGTKIYNKKTKSYVFTTSVLVTLIMFLPFEELPEPARYYITMMGAKRFQERTFGSDTLDGYTARDLANARVLLVEEDAMHEKYSMLTDNFTSADIVYTGM